MSKMPIEADEPMVLVRLSEFDRMRETIEILSNRETMRAIRQGRKELKDGKTVELEEFWKKEMNAG